MCISVCGVVLWNGTDDEIKQCINIAQFKRNYKKYINNVCKNESDGLLCISKLRVYVY